MTPKWCTVSDEIHDLCVTCTSVFSHDAGLDEDKGKTRLRYLICRLKVPVLISSRWGWFGESTTETNWGPKGETFRSG